MVFCQKKEIATKAVTLEIGKFKVHYEQTLINLIGEAVEEREGNWKRFWESRSTKLCLFASGFCFYSHGCWISRDTQKGKRARRLQLSRCLMKTKYLCLFVSGGLLWRKIVGGKNHWARSLSAILHNYINGEEGLCSIHLELLVGYQTLLLRI